MTVTQMYLEILLKIQIDKMNEEFIDPRIKKACKGNIKRLQKALDKIKREEKTDAKD